MLDLMRRKKRLKIILWLVIFSLALGMLLFFVPGVNVGSVATDTTAATVDGQPIPIKDFVNTYRKVVENYSNNGKNQTDPETLKALGLTKQVMDNLVTGKIVEVIAKRLGIEVTPNEVRQSIQTHPSLQDQGKFIGVERYKALLAANNLSVTEFEEDVRYMRLAKKVGEIITDSLDVGEKELRDEFARSNQSAQVDFIVLKKEDYKKRLKPSEDDLKAYFDAHKESYRVKEKRRIQYLMVDATRLMPSIKVTEQEILQEWNQTPHQDTVDASHILFRIADPAKESEVKARAEAVLKQAKEGKDFADLAKKHSEDTGSAAEGGYLGPFQRGQMIKEFEDAAFSLKAGEISGLVKTDYGYHIIRVLRHETPTLESRRNNLAMSVQYKKARELAQQKAEEAARLAEKSKDLGLAAKNLGIETEIKETGLFANDEGAFQIGISQAMRDYVFQMKEINSTGKALENSSGYAVPKLLEVQMPKPGNFTDAKSQVEKDYLDFKANELVQADAKRISEDAIRQGSLDIAAKAMGLGVKASRPFKFSESPDPDIGTNSAFNSAAFELAPGAVSPPISLLENSAVLQVKSRTAIDEQAFQKERPELRKKLLQAKQEPYFQDYVRKVTEELEKAGKIRINPKALEMSQTGYY